MIEVWKACGMNVDKVQFLWASDEIYRDRQSATEYWSLVTHISTKFSIGRLKHCIQILGRKDGDNNPLGYLLYAAMQCADIFFLKADICQLGMDQRKVNVLARDYGHILKAEFIKLIEPRPKPIIISHHMLSGLTQCPDPVIVDKDAEVLSAISQLTPELTKFGLNTCEVLEYLEKEMRSKLPEERLPECSKMSKSDPDSAIFMEDTIEDVNRKIRKAFCRPGVIEPNPILEYVKYIILPLENTLVIQKPQKWGGDCFEYKEYDKLEQDFVSGIIHPEDLKKSVAPAINRLLQPVRNHFDTDPEAKKLLKEVKKLMKKM
jgi:tyrosyl-tRNA synthetase